MYSTQFAKEKSVKVMNDPSMAIPTKTITVDSFRSVFVGQDAFFNSEMVSP